VTRRLLILFALVAGLVAACGLTWSIAWQRGIDDLRRNAAVRVDRTASALKSTLERYESLPYLLAEHPFVQDVLVNPTAPNVERANRSTATRGPRPPTSFRRTGFASRRATGTSRRALSASSISSARISWTR
jgi:hypothetical protein